MRLPYRQFDDIASRLMKIEKEIYCLIKVSTRATGIEETIVSVLGASTPFLLWAHTSAPLGSIIVATSEQLNTQCLCLTATTSTHAAPLPCPPLTARGLVT
jgi:hypothetical protein